jgi:hypothetical protein
MKVSAKEFDELLLAIAPLDTVERRKRYLAGDYPRAEYTKNLWRRYRWDIYRECGFTFDPGKYDDAHIDTALRKAVPDFDIAVAISVALAFEAQALDLLKKL